MTTTTKTTASPSKFQVGDKVKVTSEGHPDRWGTILMDDGSDTWPWEVELSDGNRLFFGSDELDLAEEDVVNHPSHYTQYPVEVIELTRHMPFDDGNVVKYVARSPFKGNRLQDLKKARWYLDDAIAEEEKKLEAAK